MGGELPLPPPRLRLSVCPSVRGLEANSVIFHTTFQTLNHSYLCLSEWEGPSCALNVFSAADTGRIGRLQQVQTSGEEFPGRTPRSAFRPDGNSVRSQTPLCRLSLPSSHRTPRLSQKVSGWLVFITRNKKPPSLHENRKSRWTSGSDGTRKQRKADVAQTISCLFCLSFLFLHVRPV